ncbi:MAG: S1C family serine protease [Verrucomicrobiota bacterium]|nr:S1C family serine protease [Verrucomicrobiota bacterium]
MGKPLGGVITVDDIYPFTFEDVVRRASTVDVIWFNDRRFPSEFIEVENTTDINSAILKFTNFDAFSATFRVVAPAVRRNDFDAKPRQGAFAAIADRVRFTSYEIVADLHSKASAIAPLEHQW